MYQGYTVALPLGSLAAAGTVKALVRLPYGGRIKSAQLYIPVIDCEKVDTLDPSCVFTLKVGESGHQSTVGTAPEPDLTTADQELVWEIPSDDSVNLADNARVEVAAVIDGDTAVLSGVVATLVIERPLNPKTVAG